MCGTKFLEHELKLRIPEAAFRRCSSKLVFLQILQIHRRTPVLKSLFNKVKGLKTCNFIKNRLQHRCFPAKFVKLLWTPSFTEHLWWLLLGFQKTDIRAFSYQKTDTKVTLGLLYANIAQLMADIAVVYVAAYLAIKLPGLLAYCRE